MIEVAYIFWNRMLCAVAYILEGFNRDNHAHSLSCVPPMNHASVDFPSPFGWGLPCCPPLMHWFWKLIFFVSHEEVQRNSYFIDPSNPVFHLHQESDVFSRIWARFLGLDGMCRLLAIWSEENDSHLIKLVHGGGLSTCHLILLARRWWSTCGSGLMVVLFWCRSRLSGHWVSTRACSCLMFSILTYFKLLISVLLAIRIMSIRRLLRNHDQFK